MNADACPLLQTERSSFGASPAWTKETYVGHDCSDGLTHLRGTTASRREFGRTLAGGPGTRFGSAFGALDVDAKKKRDKKCERQKTRTVVADCHLSERSDLFRPAERKTP